MRIEQIHSFVKGLQPFELEIVKRLVREKSERTRAEELKDVFNYLSPDQQSEIADFVIDNFHALKEYKKVKLLFSDFTGPHWKIGRFTEFNCFIKNYTRNLRTLEYAAIENSGVDFLEVIEE